MIFLNLFHSHFLFGVFCNVTAEKNRIAFLIRTILFVVAFSLVEIREFEQETKSDDDDVVDNFACLAHYLAHSEFRVRSEDRLEIHV